ncbi:MAG: fluoride efflux transporter CrcB [Bacteroidia bacterium]|nr:fluoride efflux transporter CrcB [Bacteroidia bacterium]
MLNKFLMVIAGGGTGALLRYSIGLLIPKASESAFPWATLLVNLLGCLAIGIFYKLYYQEEAYRLLLITGLLGGFTTFSSFGMESYQLILSKKWDFFAFYFTATNLFGILCVWLGSRLPAIFSTN